MFIGRRYLLALTDEQAEYAERISDICRAVWNTGLEQRREYRRRGAYMNYMDQCKELARAKREPGIEWLSIPPSHTLQQTLKDLDRACRTHGTWKVRWRSKTRTAPSFRFPDPDQIRTVRLSRRWGAVRLPKFGLVKFRWTRPLGGAIRGATVIREGGRWYISFIIDDGIAAAEPNGKAAVGIDRGVAVAVATSNGRLLDREFVTPSERKRLKRLHQKLSRSLRVHGRNRKSNRRSATCTQLGRLHARGRRRRLDFAAWTANRLTQDHGLIAVEDLKVHNMTRSAKGTVEQPGRNVRAKAGLNRAILEKGWRSLLLALEHKARYTGSQIVKVPPAFTSQTCNACKHVARESRESQAVFRCVACGHWDNADVNAAKNIRERGIELASAAGLAVAGRGDLGISRSVKRQPPELGAQRPRESPPSGAGEANNPGLLKATRRSSAVSPRNHR